MSIDAGGRPLCEKLFWIPTVYSRTDVNALSVNSISFRRFLRYPTKTMSEFGEL